MSLRASLILRAYKSLLMVVSDTEQDQVTSQAHPAFIQLRLVTFSLPSHSELFSSHPFITLTHVSLPEE